jgi:hypothetical protein
MPSPPISIGSNRKLIRVPHHINDPEFAAAALAAFDDVMRQRRPAAGAAAITRSQPDMPRIARKTILEKFGDMIAGGRPIIGGGAGTRPLRRARRRAAST